MTRLFFFIIIVFIFVASAAYVWVVVGIGGRVARYTAQIKVYRVTIISREPWTLSCIYDIAAFRRVFFKHLRKQLSDLNVFDQFKVDWVSASQLVSHIYHCGGFDRVFLCHKTIQSDSGGPYICTFVRLDCFIVVVAAQNVFKELWRQIAHVLVFYRFA